MDIGNEKKIVPIEWIPEMNERAKYQNKWVVLKNKKNDGVWCYLEIWPTFDGVYKIESYRESDDYSGYVDYEMLAPGTHSHFESGKFSQFWPEPGTNPAQWVRLKTPFRVHPKQPN